MTNTQVKLNPPATMNLASFNTRRQFPNNNGIATNYMGMPSKDGPASNRTDFALGRRLYLDYRQPKTKAELDELFKEKNTGPQSSNTIVKTTQREAGKPIPQNSSDLYIQRRRMLATGRGTITSRDKDEPTQLKGGEDKNFTNRARTRVKAGGTIAPPRTASKAPGPKQQSILARKYNR